MAFIEGQKIGIFSRQFGRHGDFCIRHGKMYHCTAFKG